MFPHPVGFGGCPEKLPKVPVDVFASGPKMIALGARRADRLTISVGRDPVRVAWAIEIAREARRSAGLDPMVASIGSSLVVGLDDDPAAARQMIGGVVATVARFAVMHGSPTGPVTADEATMLAQLHRSYDMNAHAGSGSLQESVLTDAFIDGYAIVGPPAVCRDYLLELFELGLDRVQLTFHSSGADPTRVETAFHRFADEVLPAIV